jgi:hypothetical protein
VSDGLVGGDGALFGGDDAFFGGNGSPAR